MTIHTVKQAVSYQERLERLVKRTIVLIRNVHPFPVLVTISVWYVMHTAEPNPPPLPEEQWGTDIKRV